MDTSRYARFERPGHARTGDRTGRKPDTRVGYQFAHAIVDDHSRLAYVELHPDERADTIVAFCERAFAWYIERGIQPRRVMTDNAWAYTHSARFRALAPPGAPLVLECRATQIRRGDASVFARYVFTFTQGETVVYDGDQVAYWTNVNANANANKKPTPGSLEAITEASAE